MKGQGLLASVFGLLGFGQKVQHNVPHAPVQGIALPKPMEVANAAPAAAAKPAVKESDGKSNRYMSDLKLNRLKAKRARQARRNSRRANNGNPKHLQMTPVRLVA